MSRPPSSSPPIRLVGRSDGRSPNIPCECQWSGHGAVKVEPVGPSGASRERGLDGRRAPELLSGAAERPRGSEVRLVELLLLELPEEDLEQSQFEQYTLEL